MKNLIKNIDHYSQIPLHKQIEEALRSLVGSEEYDNGKLFPNEVELSTAIGVSRNTVRQAFKTLVNEGLLIRKQGKGTIINKNRNIIMHLKKWDSFTNDMKQQGIKIKNYLIDFSEEKCDKELTTIFNIPLGKSIKKLTRVRGSESIPFVLFESWFHPRIPIDNSQNFSKPLNDILENEYNVIAMRSSEELQTIVADEKIAKMLRVKKGAPLFFRKRLVYDAGMRIIEYNKCFYRHDKLTYKIDINRSL